MPGVTAIITKTTKKQFSVAKLLYLDVYMESSLVIGACVLRAFYQMLESGGHGILIGYYGNLCSILHRLSIYGLMLLLPDLSYFHYNDRSNP